MKCLLDTNLISAYFDLNISSKANRLKFKMIMRKFNVVHNTVSLLEYGRNLAPNSKNLSQIKIMLSETNTIFPSLEAWKHSLNLINELYSKKGHLDRNYLRKMQMDALIAGISLEHRLLILSNDKDFDTLKSLKSGKNLKISKVKF